MLVCNTRTCTCGDYICMSGKHKCRGYVVFDECACVNGC